MVTITREGMPPGARVLVTLRGIPAKCIPATLDGHIVTQLSLVTWADGNGHVSITLLPNSAILPTGTFYLVHWTQTDVRKYSTEEGQTITVVQ